MDSAAYKLLGLCARATCTAEQYDQLAQATAAYANWQQLPSQAESHGLAPLLYLHLKQAGVKVPTDVQRQLQGLYLRHRRANQIRTQALYKILQIYQSEQIKAIVLKGAALSHIIYSEPGLRPMSDLDILASAPDAQRARTLLAKAGFPPARPATPTLLHRHLPITSAKVEGLPVHVEIHHKLHSNYWNSLFAYLGGRWLGRETANTDRALAATKALFSRARPFELADLTALTLGPEDTLKHLCQHLLSHVNVWDYCRLIWVADLASYAERFAAEIDWAHIRRHRPVIIRTLSLLHFTTPLSDQLLHQAEIKIGQAPRGLGIDFQGWPRVRPGQQSDASFRNLLQDTVLPSEWWLRLRYNLGSTRSLFLARWVQHPLHILGQMVRTMLEHLGWPRALELAGQVGTFRNQEQINPQTWDRYG